jgi:hypothetical protein
MIALVIVLPPLRLIPAGRFARRRSRVPVSQGIPIVLLRVLASRLRIGVSSPLALQRYVCFLTDRSRERLAA